MGTRPTTDSEALIESMEQIGRLPSGHPLRSAYDTCQRLAAAYLLDRALSDLLPRHAAADGRLARVADSSLAGFCHLWLRMLALRAGADPAALMGTDHASAKDEIETSLGIRGAVAFREARTEWARRAGMMARPRGNEGRPRSVFARALRHFADAVRNSKFLAKPLRFRATTAVAEWAADLLRRIRTLRIPGNPGTIVEIPAARCPKDTSLRRMMCREGKGKRSKEHGTKPI